jgi:hypothetical protein
MLLKEFLCGSAKNNPCSLIVKERSRGTFEDADMMSETFKDCGIE